MDDNAAPTLNTYQENNEDECQFEIINEEEDVGSYDDNVTNEKPVQLNLNSNMDSAMMNLVYI